MAHPKEEPKEDAWIEVETEPEPPGTFLESPYASKPAMFRTSDGTIFSVPEGFISKLPALTELRKENQDGVTDLSFDKEVAHVFFHCLCAGTYDVGCGEYYHSTWNDPGYCKALLELKRSLRVHAVAKQYEFFSLKIGAETHMKDHYKWLPLAIFMDHIRENLAYFKDDMDWLHKQVQIVLEATFEGNSSFYESSAFLENIGHSPEFDRLLAQVMGKMYRSMHTDDTEEIAWTQSKENWGW
ncbi:hypothetical protein TRV_00242 [Trichophyton verrucosum HKI 0517]|uniref:Uncharacterized protein n=1 Tax=Trichophyton verrucosum (strain HKI 0517) TaxID=663202 RepID=D4CZK0_TRIVH|nr:uncharacterized protein TRV_00242 [Trichophyton verrucosum HKI 0517]EFE44991.1 hypothetical protein TRV_00242 [Trichophyton verrucosum HKI 0517]